VQFSGCFTAYSRVCARDLSRAYVSTSINQSNLFAQNTSHLNAASGKAVDEQGQQGLKEHLQ